MPESATDQLSKLILPRIDNTLSTPHPVMIFPTRLDFSDEWGATALATTPTPLLSESAIENIIM